MQVILLTDVKNLGKAGETVTVKDGYGRNLLAKKQAAIADAKTLNDMKLKKQHEEKVAEQKYQDALTLKDKLAGMVIKVPVKVGKDDKLFGSVSSKEIADAFRDQLGIDVDKKKIVLNEAIKAVGRYEVPIKLHASVSAVLNVEVYGA
ncbi:MAG: 50S ribosomal protein L9 [Lachnospiraceae bacterium]|nr:50S ribosomal protein L9 [Lachnospiraceae bacterium]MBR4768449.1 50S ribosomal protein L9 [Lachnospiraceae bacterium]